MDFTFSRLRITYSVFHGVRATKFESEQNYSLNSNTFLQKKMIPMHEQIPGIRIVMKREIDRYANLRKAPFSKNRYVHILAENGLSFVQK